ncbi:hypothetical protein CSO01_17850 [Cellulomonas soli]|uniref:Lantibiotic n=1 Tax=Cellulomonas soli TaxID=931535 RepID=A0A512PCY5_9CELL|nr:hypothetical protein [Cellulomonas soli]GEP69070.1 hypothetical protein CSO01_17850 [Cellulomonas soli]
MTPKDPFDLDVRTTERSLAVEPQGFTTFGTTCWSCSDTCYSECCPTPSLGKFCSNSCSC